MHGFTRGEVGRAAMGRSPEPRPGARPTVLIGDGRSDSSRILRRQTFFGEGVAEAGGGALQPVYLPEPQPEGFTWRRLKGDRQWLQGSARRTMSAGGTQGSASVCPGCGGTFFSGTLGGMLSGRLCGLCSSRVERRRAGLEGMGGSTAEAAWRRKLKPETHGDFVAEGGPPPPRAGPGYAPGYRRPTTADIRARSSP